ncbi:acetyltransferase-like protein [Angomonas deanei]|uniref:Acetyltransferase (GNAT) family/Acetyltransferase (GNAT) domain containing protein, putative n=1 Tax=Angomonas deanei TaxID=59799 RepID=S9WVI8_9TRYP|nr:acetyltransferase-like protein [Angomonas deanei]EPY43481.1 acetyltransferase-like protein [Angomonas deanei]CAD2214372.1 Acetyltransferase (GNAT) family/Acetyltransferase (GNAT) domain containing protein, putative [Angomonas deanei]|eukprot:EPY42032.1 acetyltransferase-like protein [Angomonas deanei]
MSGNVCVRPAVVEDCEAMYGLIVELAVYEKCPNAVVVGLEEMKSCGFGDRPVWQAYVAERTEEEEGQPPRRTVIGMALFYDRYSTWQGRQLYLEDFVVSESCRGQGVGKLLFERVIAHAKEHHYVAMMWQALEWNEPALNFYKKYNSIFDGEWVNCKISF